MLGLALFLVGAVAETPAAADLAGLFRSDDYPVEALQKNQHGKTVAEVDVSPAGRVTACRIARSSGSAALDSATCRIIRERGQFVESRKLHPGHGFTVSVPADWRMGSSAIPIVTMVHRIIFSIAKGQASACRTEVVAGPATIYGACAAARPTAERLVRQLALSRGLDAQEFLMEMATVPGDHRADDRTGEGAGESLVSRQALLITIGRDGKVAKCEAGQSVGPYSTLGDLCGGVVANEVYEPLEADAANPSDRQITRINSVYLRPASRP